MNRALLGFLVAPLAPCLIIFIIALFQGGGDGGFWFMSLVVPISYLTAAVIGLPIHLLLVKSGHASLGWYALSGIAASLIPILFIFVFPSISTGSASAPWAGILPVHYKIMAFMLLAAVTVSATFWFVARPDRQHSRETTEASRVFRRRFGLSHATISRFSRAA
jgi:hypothetical protein